MKILIGTPVPDGDVSSEYAKSLFNLQGAVLTTRPGVTINTPRFYSSALVAHSRNAYLSVLLEDPSLTHLLFIDSDIGFAPSAVLRMLDFDKDVTGCLYPARAASPGQTPEIVATRGLIRSGDAYAVQGGFVRTRYLPAGLMLINRRAAERLRAAYPDLCAPPDSSYRGYGVERETFQCFEPLRSDSGQYMSEDYSFCRRWELIGGEMWALIDEPVVHVGWTRFTAPTLMEQWKSRASQP